MPVPTRQTSETALDQFNQQLRQSPAYQSFMVQHGLPTDGRVTLSRDQQSGLERALAAAGIQIPGGMHIDQGGNLNQKNTLGRNIGIGAAIGGAALTGVGLAGMGPLAGLGGAGAAGAAAPIAGGAPWAVTPLAAGATASGTAAGGAGMGLLGGIGKIADAAGIIGKITGNAAKNSSDQRYNENELASRNQNALNSLLASLYGTNQNAQMSALIAGSNERNNQAGIDLDQRKFALAAPGARASNAMRGSLMQNLHSASLSGLPSRVSNSIPTLHGGLNPDEFMTPEARQAGGELTRQSVMELLKGGDTFKPQTATDFQGGVMKPPTMDLAQLQQSGLLEQILGGVGLGGSILGGLGQIGDLVNKRRTPTPPMSDQAGLGGY